MFTFVDDFVLVIEFNCGYLLSNNDAVVGDFFIMNVLRDDPTD